MKKNLFFTILMVLTLCMVCSCGKKKKSLDEYREEYLTKPAISLTQSDSTEVRALVDNYRQLEWSENHPYAGRVKEASIGYDQAFPWSQV